MTSRKRLLWTLLLVALLPGWGCEGTFDQERTAPPSQTFTTKTDSDRPVIGITSVYRGRGRRSKASVWVNRAYVHAVIESGGVPVILPVNQDEDVIRQYVRQLDGLVLVGGSHIPPSAYGEKPHPKTRTMPASRYEFERRLIPLWLQTDKPLLGVCLGAQFVNVVCGGTLIQDIDSQVGTKVAHHGRGAEHLITIEPNSRLRKILGVEQLTVNSIHWQAVKDVGKDLKVVARSPDGVIEALEMTGERFCLLVQWHPERMDDPAHRKAIYGAMIRACKRKMK